jgi:hypothetical protein
VLFLGRLQNQEDEKQPQEDRFKAPEHSEPPNSTISVYNGAAQASTLWGAFLISSIHSTLEHHANWRLNSAESSANIFSKSQIRLNCATNPPMR